MILTLLGWGLSLFGCLMVYLLIWCSVSMGVCKSNKRLDGKVVVVTGGNAGIGYETIRDLAKRGARIIMACRNMNKGNAALKTLKSETGNSEIELVQLDLANFKSVRECAKKLHQLTDRIDILVNNAGTPPVAGKILSDDKLDFVLQTNHFSHFLLTLLVKDLIKKSADPRIVNVSSQAAAMLKGGFDFSKVGKGIEYPRETTYHASKLMNAYFTMEIARSWEGVESYSLHPGVVVTEIFSKGDFFDKFKKNKILWSILTSLVYVFLPYLKSCEQGAQTTLHCCLEDNLVNGEYYSDCRTGEFYMPGSRPDTTSSQAYENARRLWKLSEELTGQQDTY